jgi:hypothetical protein
MKRLSFPIVAMLLLAGGAAFARLRQPLSLYRRRAIALRPAIALPWQ